MPEKIIFIKTHPKTRLEASISNAIRDERERSVNVSAWREQAREISHDATSDLRMFNTQAQAQAFQEASISLNKFTQAMQGDKDLEELKRLKMESFILHLWLAEVPF